MKLRLTVGRVFQKLCRVFNFYDYETIYFEGGLGSQMLAYFEYQNELNAFLEGKAKRLPQTNVDYFRLREGFLENGLRIGPWLLDEYGISLDEVTSSPKKMGLAFFRPRPPVSLRSKRLQSNGFYSRLLNQTAYFSKIPDVKNLGEKIFGEELYWKLYRSNYIACASIHVRRGDFVDVASYLVADTDYIHLLNGMRHYLPSHVVLFSDSEFSESFKSSCKSALLGKEVFFCEGASYKETEVHEFMRRSLVLVAGNSTFSVTAGLLSSSGGMVVIPMQFYSALNAKLEFGNPYLHLGKFFILNR